MKKYQVMIDEITASVSELLQKQENYILIGDNSSGKSDVLKKIIQDYSESEIYFIDSVNRTFDIKKIEFNRNINENILEGSKQVVLTRISSEYFNLQESFSVTGAIEMLFARYAECIGKMFREFFGKKLEIKRETIEVVPYNAAYVDDAEVQLSSGYQAVIRLFCEICYFNDVMQSKNWTQGVVVIDEIDEYLSPKNSAEILNYIQRKFPQCCFLVTTHSLELVKNTQNTSLIILNVTEFEIYSKEQLKDTTIVENIFESLFFEERKIHHSNEDETDKTLRKLLNFKIADSWNENAQKQLDEVKKMKLSPHQKVLLKQVEEW